MNELSKWHNTIWKDKVERIAIGMHDEECLISNKNVDEDFEDELNDDEPPWELR